MNYETDGSSEAAVLSETQVISPSFMVPNIAHIHQPERRTDSAIHRDAFTAVTWTPAFPSPCGQLRHRPAAYRGRGAAVLGADAALRLRATATAHVAWQVHASLHLGHPELRRKGCRYKHRFRKNDKRSAETEKPWLCRDVAFSTFFFLNHFNLLRDWVEERSEWKRKITAGLEGLVNQCLHRQLHYCFKKQPDAKG